MVDSLKIAMQNEELTGAEKSFISICFSSVINKNADPSSEEIVKIIKRITSSSSKLKFKMWKDIINLLKEEDSASID